MIQCFSKISTATTGAGTRFEHPFSGNLAWSSVEAVVRSPISAPGTFRNLRVRVRTALGVGNSRDFTIYHNVPADDGVARETLFVTAPALLPCWDDDFLRSLLLHEWLHYVWRNVQFMRPVEDRLAELSTDAIEADKQLLADSRAWLPPDLADLADGFYRRVSMPAALDEVRRVWTTHRLPMSELPDFPKVETFRMNWAIVDKAIELVIVGRLSDELLAQLWRRAGVDWRQGHRAGLEVRTVERPIAPSWREPGIVDE